MAYRIDVGRLDKFERTPSGGMRVPAVVTTSGVFEYRQPDGSVVREYRPPEEVRHADSIASLQDAPVTLRHPAKPVTPETFGSVAVGHIAGAPKPTDEGIRTTLAIQRKDALAALESGDAKEVSMGYQVRIDETPGVTPEGVPYDRVQRDIRYNHVALGPPGWGRQGPNVSLRLDSAGDVICDDLKSGVHSEGMAGKCSECGTTRSDATAASGPGSYPWDKCMADQMAKYGDKETAQKVCASIKRKSQGDSKDAMAHVVIHHDGKDHSVEYGSGEHVAILEIKLDAAEKKAKELDVEKARADSEKVRADKAEAKIKEREDADKIAARATLETEARAVLGAETKFDGKSDRDVRVAVILKADSTFDPAGKSDDYIAARYDMARSTPAASPSAPSGVSPSVQAVAQTLAGSRQDSGFSYDETVAKSQAAAANLWQYTDQKS